MKYIRAPRSPGEPKISTPAAAALAALLACGGQSSALAGIPVIDAGNLTQNMMTAAESVTQTLKQVEQYATQVQQYQTQLQQYENMLQNTAAPAAYIWDRAQSVMSQLRTATDTLAQLKTSAGSLDSYLGKFQDVAYYRSSPCFSAAGCSPEEMAAMNRTADTIGSETQKKANDALIRGIDQQQDALATDAATLERLQGEAQGATGQMQALGAASQLASQQANQLLQIRGLLLAQQTAIAAKMQADADKEARDQAAHEQFARPIAPQELKTNATGWRFR